MSQSSSLSSLDPDEESIKKGRAHQRGHHLSWLVLLRDSPRPLLQPLLSLEAFQPGAAAWPQKNIEPGL